MEWRHEPCIHDSLMPMQSCRQLEQRHHRRLESKHTECTISSFWAFSLSSFSFAFPSDWSVSSSQEDELRSGPLIGGRSAILHVLHPHHCTGRRVQNFRIQMTFVEVCYYSTDGGSSLMSTYFWKLTFWNVLLIAK